MNRAFTCLIISSLLLSRAYTQETFSYFIPPDHINQDGGDNRSGSCGSPNGPMLGPVLAAYPPSWDWLNNNGYCYTISPAVPNATYCFTFTSPGSDITLDCGFYESGCLSYWFSNFNLYTCSPSCSLVGTGLSYTGLTPGACYTWCFQTHCTGVAGAGFNSLCPYVIYNAPLPIVLSDFYCVNTAHDMQLIWHTLSEISCDHFDVWRSQDGSSFEKIGTVNGNGNTTLEHAYSFSDDAPFETNYYKLAQVDYNGSSSWSDIISCDYNETLISINYYNLMGEKIDIETAGFGIYIREIITEHSRDRQIFYKNY